MAAPDEVGFGDAFALSAAVFYAAYLMIIKRVRAGLDGASATLWPAAVSAVALAVAALAARRDDGPEHARSAGRSSSCSASSRTRWGRA